MTNLATQYSGNENLHILLVEDDEDFRFLVRQAMTQWSMNVKFETVSYFADALEYLDKNEVDVVLLDLGLPDSQGLDSLVKLQDVYPYIPIIVITCLDDINIAVNAMEKGAQDYLVKGSISDDSLVRAIRYAIERKRLRTALDRVKQEKKLADEILDWERLSREQSIKIASRMYGSPRLRQSAPLVYEELLAMYAEVLELAMEQRMYKVRHNVSSKLQDMAFKLGAYRAGPKDVVELHTQCMREFDQNMTPAKKWLYPEEGRLAVLELMGHLVAFYRTYAVAARGYGKGVMSSSGPSKIDMENESE